MCPLEEIVKWNQERRLSTFSAPAEYSMLLEELQEFYVGYSNNSNDEMVDALCDLIVIATGGLYKLGYDPYKALLETTKEINSRIGSFNEDTGKWEKSKDQPESSLYVANYENCKTSK